jgi:hypothetical protein
MKKVQVVEVDNEGYVGRKFNTNDEDFQLDLSRVAKTFIKGGVKVYIGTEIFEKIKPSEEG